MTALTRALQAAGPAPRPPSRSPLGVARAMEDLELRARFDALTPAQRVHEFYYDENTGLANERGFEVLAGAQPPPSKPYLAHYSVDGVKWVNDTFGHDDGQMLLRVVAEALHRSDPELAKVRGDFGGRVESAKHAETIARLATERLPPDWRGFTITAGAGRTWEEAKANHVALREAMEAGGTRARRGERPPVPDGWSPRPPARWADGDRGPTLFVGEAVPLPGRVEQRNHPDLEAAYGRMTPDEAFAQAYRDPMTGVLGHVGMGVLHVAGKNVLAIDVDGLRTTDTFKEDLGDAVVRRVGQEMALLQERFGESVAAAHPHGDEYGAAHKSPDRLRDFGEALRARLAKAEIAYTDLHLGMTFVQRGIGMSYGIGPTREAAEAGLARDKTRRAALQERDVTGQTLIARGRLAARAATPDELSAALAMRGARSRGASREAPVRVELVPGGPVVTWHSPGAPRRAPSAVHDVDAGQEVARGREQWIRHPPPSAPEIEGHCRPLHERGIRAETLRAFVGHWREDDAGHVVFPHEARAPDEEGRRHTVPAGVERATRDADVVTDRERVGVWDGGERTETRRFVVVERAVDALSHYQMTGDANLRERTRYIATGGGPLSAEQVALVQELAAEHPQATIVAAFAHSAEGEWLAHQLDTALAQRGGCTRDAPLRFGGWNDSLQARERDYIRSLGVRARDRGLERTR